ncbi:DUF4157 domain-containing protein [Cellulomonas sp. KH9]|uniref:eCIS core domain-containing protein n=1 Tax=Cellulomonas sp. KH9 TaxID=1855324 RepID=UPI0008E14F0E|nr:DUF4157 domain-containing protein [Cellulomonas sp. KH9]SFK01198.1 protein of unknown function [Cellulomonas sp. KH9]
MSARTAHGPVLADPVPRPSRVADHAPAPSVPGAVSPAPNRETLRAARRAGRQQGRATARAPDPRARAPRVDGTGGAVAESAARAAARAVLAAPPGLLTAADRGTAPVAGRTLAAPAPGPTAALGPGAPLAPHVLAALAPPGAPMPAVRVHTGASAGRMTRLLGARAVTVGADVLFAPGRFDTLTTAGQALIAHELRHVADQTSAGAVRVQCSPDEVLVSTVLPDRVSSWSDADLSTAVDLLARQLTDLAVDDVLRVAAVENLFTVAMESDDRGLDCAPRAWQTLRERVGGDLAPASAVADLEAQVDVATTILTQAFGTDLTAEAVVRLDRWRRSLPLLPAGVLGPMQHRVGRTVVVVDELVALRSVTPDSAPPEPADTSDPLATGLVSTVRTATTTLIATLDGAVRAVASGTQDSTHRAARTAQEAYFDAFSRSFTYSVEKARKGLPTGSSIPQPRYLGDIDVWPNRWYGHATEKRRFDTACTTVAQELDALGTFTGLWARPVAERAAYLVEHGDAALAALHHARPLQIAYAALAYSSLVRYETHRRYQMNWDDAELDGGLAGAASRALDLLDAAGEPDERALVSLQDALTVRIAEAEARFEHLRDMDTAIEWIATIASIVIGVGVMRLGLMALRAGVAWTAGRALAPTVTRFVVGSLLFTAGSTVGRGALTGQWPTLRQLGTQTALDMATFGIARGAHALVGFAYAASGSRLTAAGIVAGMRAAPPVAVHAATFVAMWAWGSTLAIVTADGPMDASAIASTIARTGARTALDLVVLHYATRLVEPPAAPTTGLDATVGRQWEALRAQSRDVGGRLQEWLRRPGRDPAEFRRLTAEGESVLLRMREVMGRMFELTPSQRAGLDTMLGDQLRMIETLRQGVDLGVEQTGDVVWRYRGPMDALETYLGRLQRAGTVDSFVRGRGGVVEVRFADGRIAFFAPRGAPSPVVEARPDTTGAAVRTSAPALPAAVQADAVLALRLLPPGEGARVAGALGPPGSSDLVAWLARPDVLPLLRGTDPFGTGPRLREMLADAPAAELIRGMRPADVAAWWAARPTPDMSAVQFAQHLQALRSFRGTLELSAPGQAVTETARFGRSVADRPLVVHAPAVAPGPSAAPSTSAPLTAGSATVTSTGQRARINDHLAAAGFEGHAMVEIRGLSETWVVDVVAGVPVRAWRFSDGPRLVVADLPLETRLAEVRRAVEDAETLAQVDRVRATERLAGVRALVEQLDVLRTTRAPDLADARNLLERAQPDRFVPQPVLPGPVLEPATFAESLGRRRAGVMARAARMNLPRDAGQAPSAAARVAVLAVEALRPRNPRGASAPDTLAAIERQALAAEQALDRLSLAAYDRVVGRLGVDVVAAIRGGRLGALTDVQLGEVMESLRSRQLVPPGASPDVVVDTLRGYLHALNPPPGVRSVAVERILDAAPTAAARGRAMQLFGRLAEAQVPGVHDVLRAMVGSRTSWRGGMFALEMVVRGGPENVLAVEVRESVPDPSRPRDVVRVYDMVRRAAAGRPAELQTIELKDWSRWFEESIRSHGADGRSQFERDVLLRTAGLTDPTGLRRLSWVFRGPGPAVDGLTDPAQVQARIRSVMRGALDALLADQAVPLATREMWLREFDAYSRIVEIVELDPASWSVRRLAPDPEVP